MNTSKKAILGILLGLFCGILYIECNIQFTILITIFDIIQIQFLNILKLLSGPLIFLTLLNGISLSNSHNTKDNLNNLLLKAFCLFIFTTMFAITIGIYFGYLFKPGIGFDIDYSKIKEVNSLNNNLLSFNIPTNIVSPFLLLNLVQIVFLAVLFGLFIRNNYPNNTNTINIISELNDMFLNGIGYIMEYAYILSFSATFVSISTNGYYVLYSLSKLVLTVILAKIFQYIVLLFFIFTLGRLSVYPFIIKSIPYQLLSFATSSTKASLPETLNIAQKTLGISKRVSRTIIPLGSAINMDGTAVYIGAVVIFFAQIHGIVLSWYDIFNIILSSTLGSIGAAGIPSGSLIVIPYILSSAGIPSIYFGILFSIDRLLDMIRTVLNMTGDVAVALILDAQENTLDQEKYYKL